MRFPGSLDWRRVTTAAVTLALAFACGYVTQHHLADVPVTRVSLPPAAGPLPQSSATAPHLIRPPVLPDRVREARGASRCGPRLFVNAAPAATLRIDLYAPCQPGVPVELRQGEIRAALRTDADGRLHLRMPALSAEPQVELRLDGRTMRARVEVPGAAGYRHVALLWDGRQALRINAYEFGASQRQRGHVWEGAPKSPARAIRGAGGYLTRLGDGSGAAAEIYSFPVERVAAPGVVRLVVEAEVTEADCGGALDAQALQSGLSGGFSRTRIALAMPDCERVGETVRLQNLLSDMRLAAR